MGEEFLKTYTFRNNKELSRFELCVKGRIAYVDYIFCKGILTLINTFVPQELHSINGLGETLLHKIKKYANSKSISLSSKCPYAKALMRKV